MMNMVITKLYAQRLRQEFAASPLKKDEVRRIEGLGDLYVALKGSTVPEQYAFAYSLWVDDIEHVFYHRYSDGSGAE